MTKSSPESPAKEQPGDVAAMVKRLRDEAVTMLATGYENIGLDTIDLLREAAALIERLAEQKCTK